VLANRSVPPCTVIPNLYYPDPGTAADWLCKAFGFTVRLRIANHRIQMKFGDGCLIVAEATSTKNLVVEGPTESASDAQNQPLTHLTMLRVPDADGLCERARQAGARILKPPTDYPYGERQCNLEDPFGHRWTLTQSIADVAPEDWGGTPVDL
jgi:uncharacterized glyoxalase superfamily protein PhnB